MPVILGIESSCDETSAAIVENGWLVRSNVVATQHELHKRYGGVVPEIASRAHIERISPVITESLSRAGLSAINEIDAVAVGNRPGLIGSLLVGLSSAKAIAWLLDKPLIGIDHIEAHLHAGLLKDAKDLDDAADTNVIPEIPCPALGMVVSGGHTSLYLLLRDEAGEIQYHLIGKTIDDAVGEAYDKAANILHIGYPGGPKLDKMAKSFEGDKKNLPVKLPRSMLSKESLDFSFSGLKTALLYGVCGKPIKTEVQKGSMRKKPVFERSGADLNDEDRAAYAWCFQDAAVDTVIKKLNRAMDQYAAGDLNLEGSAMDTSTPIQSLVLGGGVSANSHLRASVLNLCEQKGLTPVIPKMAYCLDNAAMIAGLAHHRHLTQAYDDLKLPAIATTGL